jgi:MFS family permease
MFCQNGSLEQISFIASDNSAMSEIPQGHVTQAQHLAHAQELERSTNYHTFSPSPSDQDGAPEQISDTAQAGVQQIEATALAWNHTHLITVYALIWLVYFLDSLQQNVTGSFTPWVTSSFGQHSLTPVVGVASGLVGGLWKLTLAKVLDVFGRPQGYAMSVVILTLGLGMMALCRDVQTYAAAQVLYWVGFNGVVYALNILVADTSALKSRGLMIAFTTSPYIITAWIGGPVAETFLTGPGFRWGFATFAVATPIICAPLFVMLIWMLRKARGRGLVADKRKEWTVCARVKHYAEEFDLVGLFLITAGSALLLLPFSLAPFQQQGWRSPLIIGMIIVGPQFLTGFAFWERYRPDTKTFLPYRLLKNRTILGACSLSAVLFSSFYIWNSYFLSYLQVVHDLNPTRASYVYYIYNIGSCLISLVAGFVVLRRGRFKMLALLFGLPMNVLGLLLMIVFRRAVDAVLWKTILAQIVISIAGGTLLVAEQLAVQSPVDHQHVAVVLAVQGVFASIGGAIGGTIATTIWQNVFARKLVEYLPDDLRKVSGEIFGDLAMQKSFAVGTAARWAINRAYAEAQVTMLVVAVGILGMGFGFVMLWEDVDVTQAKQVKGTVF